MDLWKSNSWACRGSLAIIAATSSVLAADPDGSALLQSARQQVTAWHAGQKPSHRKLRVVYFIPTDRAALPKHEERLDRILNDVSHFYREGFQRFGVQGVELPLEKKDGRLVIHEVRGKLPASSYNYESGSVTAAEIQEALKGEIDMAAEQVLVLYALCRKEPDGRYVFDAPYYGGAPTSNQFGICHAADCELLDPLLLTATDKAIVYTEHYYPRVE